jgi:O-antigen/teichoic acid export membrane protein
MVINKDEQQTSYREIMKATSLFGGVQVINILISIIRTKFVAIILGPSGVGIVGLLISTTDLVGRLTNFGLGTSAVKNVASANESGNQLRINTILVVLQRLVWITGLLGFVFTIVFSSILSQIAFGDKSYTLSFVWISITLLFNQLSSGQLVVLQGLRKLKHLAKANLYGSILGLIISVPLYYKYGVEAIAPTIIFTSLGNLLLTWYFAGKIKVEGVKVSSIRTIAEGKKMLKMGFVISLSGMIAMGASYFVRIFISNTGGVEQVGLYNAGFAIINSYVGLIFSAMGTDYYPRLSAVSHSDELCKNIINQQAEIAILILGPIIMAFLVFINWVVIILYSSEFVGINDMLHWVSIGMFFKAAGWSIGFIFLAKGASKLFFLNELVANIYMLVLNVFGYHFMGLTGVGISFLAGFMLYLLQVSYISKRKFNFSFETGFSKIILIQVFISVICFLVMNFLMPPYSYFIGALLIMISSIHSVRELDKRIGLKNLMRKFLKRT